MTIGMEFHDARLLDFMCGPDGDGYVLFHACVYRSNGVVFKDPQESGWQKCRLAFRGMRVKGDLVEEGEYTSEGALWVNGEVYDNVILLPANYEGSIQVNLVMSPLFEKLEIHAESISTTLEGSWEFEREWN